MTAPEIVICHYRVAQGKEDAFLELVGRHWPALRKLDLVTEAPSTVYRGTDDQGRTTLWEIFSWKNAEAVERAHTHPEVLAIWEPMGALCEPHDGRPAMEFPHVEQLPLAAA